MFCCSCHVFDLEVDSFRKQRREMLYSDICLTSFKTGYQQKGKKEIFFNFPRILWKDPDNVNKRSLLSVSSAGQIATKCQERVIHGPLSSTDLNEVSSVYVSFLPCNFRQLPIFMCLCM